MGIGHLWCLLHIVTSPSLNMDILSFLLFELVLRVLVCAMFYVLGLYAIDKIQFSLGWSVGWLKCVGVLFIMFMCLEGARNSSLHDPYDLSVFDVMIMIFGWPVYFTLGLEALLGI